MDWFRTILFIVQEHEESDMNMSWLGAGSMGLPIDAVIVSQSSVAPASSLLMEADVDHPT